jgi:UDPglucose 6-dehydrogenase
MKIAVIGTGYVGLVTGTCFAETGNTVVCVDIDEHKIEKMKNGIVPIYEPGLENLFHKNIERNHLSFTTNLEEGIKGAKIIFLALPTPPGEDGSADLKYVLGVAEDLGKLITDYVVIVDKSTVPVGTAEKVAAKVRENYNGDFDVVSNPEFLKEGAAVDDFLKPDRVVIGANSENAKNIMGELYQPFVRNGHPIMFMDIRSAELTKYAANSFLALKISYMNEIANLCETLGANVDSVRLGIGSDSRIGEKFLYAGPGWGGSCFPKDVLALQKTSKENGHNLVSLDAAIDANKAQLNVVFNKLSAHFSGNLKGINVAVWGLAFKANTDDIRESPAINLIDSLLAAGANVTVHDPEAMENIRRIYGDKLTYATDELEMLKNKDVLAIMTEWNIYRTPNFDTMKVAMNNPVIVDGRNLFQLTRMKTEGFTYYSIGRANVQ